MWNDVIINKMYFLCLKFCLNGIYNWISLDGYYFHKSQFKSLYVSLKCNSLNC